MLCLGLSGKGGGMMNKLCDHNLVVPSDDTARIQEMHILIIHTLCQIIDEGFNESFIINLERSLDRKEHMKNKFKSF